MIAVLLLLARSPGLAVQQQVIRVSDSASGCFHQVAFDYAWSLQRDGNYRYKTRQLSVGEVERIRSTVLEAREEPPDLLVQIGFTPESLRAHRSEILQAVLPETYRDVARNAKALPVDLEQLFSYDRLAPHVLYDLKGGRFSTNSFHFSVVLPGDPVIEVTSKSEVPWMLPWTIRAGQEQWQVADIAVSKEMQKLADQDGACSFLLDGTTYWRDEFWTDMFWETFVGEELDKALSMSLCAQLPGYDLFAERFEVEDVITGSINMLPEAVYFYVHARNPGPLDSARWWNVLEQGQPVHDFHAFLRAFDRAESQVRRQTWLLDWKKAGSDRSIGVDIVGDVPHSEERMDFFVEPAWRHAGFEGLPQTELILRAARGATRGTVYLSDEETGALIVDAWPGEGSHWFDAFDLHFHPRAEPPTYARVDAQGRFEMRIIE